MARMGPESASPPRASVVVPVRNGAATLPDLLQALESQELPGGLEVVALDSGSSDGSRELLAHAGARVEPIAAREFDHGATRNLGARLARGGHVLFLTQDAIPAGADFARRLVEALAADARLAGAFARQVPRADADTLTRRDLERWPAASREARTVFVADVEGFDALPPADRYRLSVFDNVASAVRREHLLAHPFAPTRFGEDIEWGLRMLRLGYGLRYVPEAVVVHSHRRTARALFRRNYLGHRALLRLFGLRTIPDGPHLVRAALGSLCSDLATLVRCGAKPRAWLAMPAQALAATWGQYRGGCDEALGRPHPDWSA
jgi:rhamnosyltransferase